MDPTTRFAITLHWSAPSQTRLVDVETITLIERARNAYDATYQAVIRARRDFGWDKKAVNDVTYAKAL